MRDRITLTRRPDGWYATYHGPYAAEVRALFGGTDTLPTAYTARAEADTVLREIRRLNPGVEVSVE